MGCPRPTAVAIEPTLPAMYRMPRRGHSHARRHRIAEGATQILHLMSPWNMPCDADVAMDHA